MYAKGPDWWIDQYADVEIPEDRWVKAMEIKTSNRRIVHHAVVNAIEPHAPAGTPETGVQLTDYAVGKYGDKFAEITVRLLKKGTRLRFDMHYNAAGSEQINHTTIAFKFYPKGFVPKYQVRSYAVRNFPADELEIPPNSVVRNDGYFRLPKNARIDSFQPHMHMRGKAMTLEAINLDNSTTILSSVDHFDFNWHVNYVYSDDVAPLLPAGTVLHMIGIHDNTSANRHNPDPNMWVGFGERSVDDMVQVWMDMVYLDDAGVQALAEERKAQSGGRGAGIARCCLGARVDSRSQFSCRQGRSKRARLLHSSCRRGCRRGDSPGVKERIWRTARESAPWASSTGTCYHWPWRRAIAASIATAYGCAGIIIRQDQYRRLAIVHEIARHGEDEVRDWRGTSWSEIC